MMKKIITALLITVSGITAHAADACHTLGIAAENTMMARQLGMPMGKVMEMAQGESIIETIILDAYRQPRFSSESLQMKAAEDFRYKWENKCYNSRK